MGLLGKLTLATAVALGGAPDTVSGGEPAKGGSKPRPAATSLREGSGDLFASKTSSKGEETVPHPSANLTFKEFSPIKRSEMRDDMKPSDVVKVAYEHGLLSHEAINDKNGNAHGQFIEAIRSVKNEERGLALNRLTTALSELIEAGVFTVPQARDIMMRHTNAANFIATRLNGKLSDQGRVPELDRSKSAEYYNALMQVESVPDGNRLLHRLENDSQQYVAKN